MDIFYMVIIAIGLVCYIVYIANLGKRITEHTAELERLRREMLMHNHDLQYEARRFTPIIDHFELRRWLDLTRLEMESEYGLVSKKWANPEQKRLPRGE
jgi:hypothetical protein